MSKGLKWQAGTSRLKTTLIFKRSVNADLFLNKVSVEEGCMCMFSLIIFTTYKLDERNRIRLSAFMFAQMLLLFRWVPVEVLLSNEY